jgi:hypothetical protein
MKLSDTQLLILSSASQRTDHAAVLPANLKGSAAKKVVDRLLNEKLLQEFRAKDDMPVWRRGDGNRPYSLRITKAGLRAIDVEKALLARRPRRRPSHIRASRAYGTRRSADKPAEHLSASERHHRNGIIGTSNHAARLIVEETRSPVVPTIVRLMLANCLPSL